MPPKYRGPSSEVQTYAVVDIHGRVREWTGDIADALQAAKEMDQPFLICDSDSIVQLCYVVSIDPLDAFLEAERGEEDDDDTEE